MGLGRALLALFAALWLCAAAPPGKTIVLIGGSVPHNPNVHDKAGTVAALAKLIAASPALKRLTVRAYPAGWPADPAALDDAATVVWYFDGAEHHPLRDPSRRAQVERLVARGGGLIALHQAGTVRPDDGIDLDPWLGATRPGMIDRTTQVATVTPLPHPVTRGVRHVTYREEFYPTLRFAAGAVPVARAMLSDENDASKPASLRTVAWVYQRPGGGRAFGYTGTHFLTSLDEAPVRQLLLNAIAWTAGLKVPAKGVRP